YAGGFLGFAEKAAEIFSKLVRPAIPHTRPGGGICGGGGGGGGRGQQPGRVTPALCASTGRSRTPSAALAAATHLTWAAPCTTSKTPSAGSACRNAPQLPNVTSCAGISRPPPA